MNFDYLLGMLDTYAELDVIEHKSNGIESGYVCKSGKRIWIHDDGTISINDCEIIVEDIETVIRDDNDLSFKVKHWCYTYY